MPSTIIDSYLHCGTSRTIWGSNYPVVGDVSDYAADLDLIRCNRRPISEYAAGDILGNNAGRLWFAPPLS